MCMSIPKKALREIGPDWLEEVVASPWQMDYRTVGNYPENQWLKLIAFFAVIVVSIIDQSLIVFIVSFGLGFYWSINRPSQQ